MMNGSIICCSMLDVDWALGELALRGLFAWRKANIPFVFDVYAHWAPERVGRYGVEILFKDRRIGHMVEAKHLKYEDVDVTDKHVEDHYYGLYVTKVYMPGLEQGRYSIDLVVDGVLTASHPLNIDTKLGSTK